MDGLVEMRVFVAVAEAGSFVGGARRLGLSPPAVTRGVAALERRLGARLLNRTTRVVRLTEAGARFLADCRRILGEVEEAEASVAGDHGEPRGTLSVTAPVMFGRRHVAPAIFRFLERYPRITVRTVFVDRVADLIDEGLDVAVRIAALPDSGLTAVRVGAVRPVLCASPAYLARRGRPRVPADLAGHDTIGSAAFAGQPWGFLSGGGRITVRTAPRLLVNTVDVGIAAAIDGLGIARVLSYQVADEVRSGALEILLAEHELPAIPIHVVHVDGRNARARVRAFVDLVAPLLRDRLRAGFDLATA